MFLSVCSAILPVCLGAQLCSQDRFPTGTAAPVHLQTQPHHGWLTPSKAVSLSPLISFIPAFPGSSVTPIDPNITALHMASWIFPCCGPSCASFTLPQGGHCSPPEITLSLWQEGQGWSSLQRETWLLSRSSVSSRRV